MNYFGDEYVTGEELMHYGVKGMRWGVIRAKKRLSKATTDEERDKAVSKLNKHREKGSSAIRKLDKQTAKLEKQRDKRIVKDDAKAADYHRRAIEKKARSTKRFISTNKALKLKIESEKLELKADRIKARSEQIQSRIDKNRTIQKGFQQQIDLIDQTLVDSGRRYLEAG